MSHDSPVSIDIDLEADGIQFGNLKVPQSTNSAGWAQYYIPIVVINNGTGPTAVISGGNHGDEYEGQVTLMNLARSIHVENVRGRIIIIPMLNRPAAMAGTRLSPLDGKNMNRAFPGSKDDDITGQIAHFVAHQIIPLADLVVDIHSGGSSMHFLPSVNMHELTDPEQMNQMLDAAKASRAPYIFLYADVAGSGLLPSYAEDLGKITLGTEMGSKAQFGKETLKITSQTTHNLLVWLGVLDEPPEGSEQPHPVLVSGTDPRDYVMAPCSGILEPLVELGDPVKAGDLVAQIHNPERIQQEPTAIHAATDGIIMCRRSNPLTRQGEVVVTVVRVVAEE
ncbi:MAG: succinylglutamate desuccinylase/aspartoacylase family protein [Planctomycetota bacterium]|nr:succinylglutamate desuccinylase/aspartoacylase family protein [Planctomycetota bacterium]